jgi:hypothetical protein
LKKYFKKNTILLLATITILSCKDTTKSQNDDAKKHFDSLSKNNKLIKFEVKSYNEIWYDNLIANYIKNSENKLIKSHIKNKDNMEWLLDRTEKTDSTNYFIFNIGQEVSEKDGSELRFSSDGWIYIDSLTKKIYEYDLPNDSLILWKNKRHR